MNLEFLVDGHKIDILLESTESKNNRVFLFSHNKTVPLTLLSTNNLLANTLYTYRFSLEPDGIQDMELEISYPDIGPRDYSNFKKATYHLSRIQRVMKRSGELSKEEVNLDEAKLSVLQITNEHTQRTVPLLKQIRSLYKTIGAKFSVTEQKAWLIRQHHAGKLKLENIPLEEVKSVGLINAVN